LSKLLLIFFKTECHGPPSVPRAQPQFDVNSPPNATGAVLEYTCDAGYSPQGSVRCQADGTWTQMSCTEDCPSPPLVPNSNQLFNASTVARSQGTSLQYACQTGFVPENDLTTITCQENSTWTNIVCKRSDCPSPPVIVNSNEQFVRSTASTVYGATLQYGCKSGFVAENGVTTVTCGEGGLWTSMVCKPLRSCSEVKACNSQYGDGEYWIYPAPYGTTKVKIYCRDMNSSSPTEFVTLNVENVGYSPRLANPHCQTEAYHNCTQGGGKTHYSKIRVRIQTMQVNRRDKTFAKTYFGNPLNYGQAADCYTSHLNGTRATCGPKGTFNIDTTGTGLVVDKMLTFPVTGWRPWGQVVRNADGTTIDLLCGGRRGRCAPSGPMILKLGPTGNSPRLSTFIETLLMTTIAF
ncbi:complement factor H-related protein 3-like, partial [Gigantopelta aegis]|uniref:complement factor H-related protein 3-like n=1 Tax=Gigantopelta aegis TaxID=1735272 RepID=UPI001B88C156